MLGEPSIILRIYCLLHVFINTDFLLHTNYMKNNYAATRPCWFDSTQFSYIPLCSPNTCKDVFNPNLMHFSQIVPRVCTLVLSLFKFLLSLYEHHPFLCLILLFVSLMFCFFLIFPAWVCPSVGFNHLGSPLKLHNDSFYYSYGVLHNIIIVVLYRRLHHSCCHSFIK